jgi:hypothetical protein
MIEWLLKIINQYMRIGPICGYNQKPDIFKVP